ncbi:MAG: 4Fe-4S dicluster domain-containing protein, partial [Lachnospiraceae bacterium]|nr:4Fe-4S dicluster domain-containing protein [Lachnospiraceae bacterium]
PLRGGRLASLKPEEEARLTALRPEESIPAWAFRFLQSLPQICVTLSGMSDLQQMKENIATYEEAKPLNGEEMSTLMDVADGMTRDIVVPCTACHYCVSHCPQELPIPELLNVYNEHRFTGGGFIPAMYVSTLPEEKRPGACLGCGSCEAVCPQQIHISEAMADFAARLKE